MVGIGASSIGRSVPGVVRIAVTALSEFGVCVCMFGNGNDVVSNELWHCISVCGMTLSLGRSIFFTFSADEWN